MLTWFQILSELFIDIAAAWFIAVFVEFRLEGADSPVKISVLLIKFGFGIMSLSIAKYLRDKTKGSER